MATSDEQQHPSKRKSLKRITGWNVFYQAVGPKIQERLPEKNIATMSTVASHMWKELGERRKDWRDEAQKIREETDTNQTSWSDTCSCGRTFPKKNLYTHHLKHCGKAVCKDCGLHLKDEKALNRHYHIVHTKKFECPCCGKCFGDKKDLTRHTDTNTKKKYKCEICGMDVSTKSNLTRHKKTQHCS